MWRLRKKSQLRMNTNEHESFDLDDSFAYAAIREYTCSFVAEILVLKSTSITRPWTSVSRMSRPLKR